jgi:VCBS repeat-containing protein
MRSLNRFAVLSLAALAACANAPRSYMVTTPQPADAAYSCAVSQINQLGYTLANTNAAGGMIVAEKQSSGLGLKLMFGQTKRDQLTVSIFDGANGTGRQIRVTAAETGERANIVGTSHEGATKPSDKAVADANTLLLACGTGPVTKQSSAAFSYTTSVGQ